MVINMDEQLERFKNMTPEEANAYLEDFEQCTHDCETCGEDCSDRKEKPAKKVIAVISGKGGTGKTTVTVLLAKTLQRLGLRPAILDADVINAGVPHLLGMTDPVIGDSDEMLPAFSPGGLPVMSMALISEEKTEPIIWSGIDAAKISIYLMMNTIWDSPDVLLIDMPTGAGDIPIEYFTTMPMECSLVVATPGEFSAMPIRRVVNLAEMLMVPVMGVVENFGGEGFSLSDTFADIPVVAELAYDEGLRRACDAGRLEDYETDAFDNLARLISESIQK